MNIKIYEHVHCLFSFFTLFFESDGEISNYFFPRDNQVNKCENLAPFRDSKLTRLFQRALTGRESLAMIVNVNPSPLLREETLNVLTFSAVAKQVFIFLIF